MSTNDRLSERQAPSNDSQAWKDDNFSGLYTGSDSTFLLAYWNQNMNNVSQQLVVLFQGKNFANGITQGRYTSNSTTSNPWVANNFGFSHPKGSTFAMCLASYRSGKHMMLYTVDDSKKLQQREYTINDSDLDPDTVVSLMSESGTWPAQCLLTVRTTLVSPLTTELCRHRLDPRATIASRRCYPRQPVPIHVRRIARVHAQHTLDQPDPFRRSGPQLLSAERVELHVGLLRSDIGDRASPEGEHDISLPGSHERQRDREWKRVRHV